MDFILKHFQYFIPPLTVFTFWFCYWFGRISFFIVRRIDRYFTMLIYCNISEEKVHLIDNANAIRDNYKDGSKEFKPNDFIPKETISIDGIENVNDKLDKAV